MPSAEILSIQVSTGGECRLSLSDITLLEKLVINGFLLHKERVFPSPFEKKTIQIHIHDLPIWIPNCVVENSLTQYGTLVGNVRHGTLKGTNIVNGVRFATFAPKPRASVPPCVLTPDGQVMFRVFYDGQPETCRHCSSTGHVARDCPQPRRPNRSSTSRRWESVNNTASPSESKNGSNNNKDTSTQDTPQTKAYTQKPIANSSTIAQPPTRTNPDDGDAEDEETGTSETVLDGNHPHEQRSNSIRAENLLQAITQTQSETWQDGTPKRELKRKSRSSSNTSPESIPNPPSKTTRNPKKPWPEVPGSRFHGLPDNAQ